MDEKIKDAYERMTPAPEQEERMFARIQAYAATQASATESPDAMPQESSDSKPTLTALSSQPSSSTSLSASAKRGNRRLLKIALPVAACLLAVAIGVGIGVNSLGPHAAITGVSGVAASLGASNDSAKATATESHGGNAPAEGYATDREAAESAVVDAGTSEEIAPFPGENFNTEEYAAVDENGFVSTRTQPLSTVSADVDTASYANLRRLLRANDYDLDGIPSGAVRTEEMLNYFTYNYAQPSGNDLFGMQACVSTCPWNPDTKLLVLGFATREETGVAEKGANLVFLIDVSGSMNSPDKLALLQDSFATLLENLDANDRVSIVTYSGSEAIVLEGVSGDEDQQILRAIYSLKASGSTNGEAGLRMAYEVAERNYIDGGVNRIIMASDGDLNVGMTSESDLYDFVEQKRETGIYLSVLGFGSGNYKDTKMEILADHGNGSYHYIDCIEEADRVLSDHLMANLVPFADDVKIQVEFNPSQVKGYRLIGYENRALADESFTDDGVDAGDVGPNAQFTVAYEIVPVDSAYEINVPDLKYGQGEASILGGSEWLTCSLRYRAYSDRAVHQQQLIVSALDETAQPTDDWMFQAAVIEFSMLAAHSSYVGSADLASVLELLDSTNLDADRMGFREIVANTLESSSGSYPGDNPTNHRS